ncbi:MAG: spiro-SPASM protein [Treponema sp.]|jgi:spiro-SPASM protein|nr:spiro-SPASM protein [Treponema sp.]
MNALLVLYSGNLSDEAFEPVFEGKNSVFLAIERAKMFPGVKKTVLFTCADIDLNGITGVEVEKADSVLKSWTKQSLLERISVHQAGFDCVYFAFADCPFLDPALAGALVRRHLENKAEYSYADGWPYGLAPEMLAPGTAGILAKIVKDDGPVERDILFSVIQKDINAFDIEAEISSVDLRCHRLSLCADSKRNLLLLSNFIGAAGGKIPGAGETERLIQMHPEILRTLPCFFPIQVSGGCPQNCSLCPYTSVTEPTARKDFMDSGKFESLLDKISAFCGDAVIDLSLWGEPSLHPEKLKLIEAVLSRSELSLIIETSGIGWKTVELEKIAGMSADFSLNKRKNRLTPLSWIVSLDTTDPSRYAQMRGQGFAEANDCAKKLLSLFPKNCYVQAVRTAGSEEDTEKFYRFWKDAAGGESNIIIQKYDDFCGALEKRQASDISPLTRQPCWHIMRDMVILLDGTAPVCREDLSILKGEKNNILGNVFTGSLESIWQNGEPRYLEQCKKNYSGTDDMGLCANCDEYYTYNF